MGDNWETLANLSPEEIAARLPTAAKEEVVEKPEPSAPVAAAQAAAQAAVALPRKANNNANWNQPIGPKVVPKAVQVPRIILQQIIRPPPESRALTSANISSFESGFPFTKNLRGDVHQPHICQAGFGSLAKTLNSYLSKPTNTQKRDTILGHLTRCIAKRIANHHASVRREGIYSGTVSDKQHLAFILMLHDLYSFLEQKFADSLVDVTEIKWTDVGASGYFTVSYGDKPVSTGGKRKSRKLRRHKRKQTRRRR